MRRLSLVLAVLASCDAAPDPSSPGSSAGRTDGSGSAGFSADLAAKLDRKQPTTERTPAHPNPTEGRPPVPAGRSPEPSARPAASAMPAGRSPEPSPSAASTAPKLGAEVVVTPSARPASVSAELKSINLDLLPNWERDTEGPGTLSLVVKAPNHEPTTFVFRYGIEDPKAPADRDAYKKWLADNKIFVTKDDRQKGAAWYLEGLDGNKKPTFRMVITYGGKKLICYGSLYKDSGLGDLRDQTIIQAKQICETLTL